MFAEGVIFLKKMIFSRCSEGFKAYYRKVVDISDSPKKIAGGVAIGLAFDFLPLPVISIPVSYLIARLARCNAVAAVATVVFFKLAVPFFFTLNIVVGNSLFGDIAGPEIASDNSSLSAPLLQALIEHGYSFLFGSLVNATFVGLAVYFLLVFLLERRRKWRGA